MQERHKIAQILAYQLFEAGYSYQLTVSPGISPTIDVQQARSNRNDRIILESDAVTLDGDRGIDLWADHKTTTKFEYEDPRMIEQIIQALSPKHKPKS
jgi:hypothetical protein